MASATARKISEYYPEMSSKRARPFTEATMGAPRRSTIPVAPSVKKYVKNCMQRQSEKKYVNNAAIAQTCAPAGTIWAAGPSLVSQGTTDATRIGNIIQVRSFYSFFSFVGSDGYGPIRVLVYRDKQCNGAVASITDILQQATAYGVYNNDNVVGYGGARFNILYDKTIDLISSETAVAGFRVSKTFIVKPSDVACNINYDGNAGTIADLTGNDIRVIVFGPATFTYSFNSTMCFTDN